MKVVLGIGGSEDSFRALEWTIDRVLEAGDDLTIAILDNPESSPSPGRVAERARAELDAAGLSAPVIHLEGDPGSTLVEFAETEDFDAIVLGGGERSPMGKVSVGHIAEFVVLNASISVTLVR